MKVVEFSHKKGLSRREYQVMVYLARGWTNKEIAGTLGISQKTVDTHRGHVLQWLRLRNNSDITRYAIQQGIIDADGNVLNAAQREIAQQMMSELKRQLADLAPKAADAAADDAPAPVVPAEAAPQSTPEPAAAVLQAPAARPAPRKRQPARKKAGPAPASHKHRSTASMKLRVAKRGNHVKGKH